MCTDSPSLRPNLRPFGRRAVRLLVCIALAIPLGARTLSAQTLANYRFSSAGWATFGLALPKGAAQSAVSVGSLTTQTDIKTVWPDGSIRFAVVTANIPSAGTYAITPGIALTSAYTPTWPSATVSFLIGTTTYTASLTAFTATNSWLTGPLVREARVVVVPNSSAGPHPLLQVFFDVRSYAGGGHRVDVTVQNVRDVVDMDKVTYDLTIMVGGTPMLSKPAFTQYGFTRWRKTFTTGGLTEATVLPDFEPFYTSAALPRFLTSVINAAYDMSLSQWDINRFGSMNPIMESGGYRPELSPFPAWQAQYLVHKNTSQRAATMLNGNNSGSWSMHITKADGVSMIKVTEPGFESYWFDYFGRNKPGPGPAVPLRPDNNLRGLRKNVPGGYSDVESSADPEHLPNLTYLPYLVTGDRYYLDQTKLWAVWAIINLTPQQPVNPEPVFEPAFERSRRGSKGLIWTRGLTRELGHPLQVLAMAGVITPDADPDKAYLKEIFQNQLDALGSHATSIAGTGGVAEAMGWETWVSKDGAGNPNGRYMSLWRLSYPVFAVDFAAQQEMWTVGNALEFCRRAVRSQIGFITNGTTSSEKIPSYPTVALLTNNGTTLSFFSSWTNLFLANKLAGSQIGTSPPPGYHGVEAHVLLTVGRRLAVPGAEAAYQWLFTYHDSFGSVLSDLNVRSGYALASAAAGSIAPAKNVIIR
jgi:hypothetical protein